MMEGTVPLGYLISTSPASTRNTVPASTTTVSVTIAVTIRTASTTEAIAASTTTVIPLAISTVIVCTTTASVMRRVMSRNVTGMAAIARVNPVPNLHSRVPWWSSYACLPPSSCIKEACF